MKMSNKQRKVPEEAEKNWNKHLLDVGCNQDQASFKALFDHFAPLIKAFAYKVSQHGYADQFAEELVQETMIKVWSKASSFDASKAQATTWIYTIARNTRIDLLRKNSKFFNDSGFENDGDEYVAADNIWGVEEEQHIENAFSSLRDKQQLHAKIANLPLEQSNILQKVFLEDRTHQEAALELGIPLGTVKSRVRVALAKLRVVIDV